MEKLNEKWSEPAHEAQEGELLVTLKTVGVV
jgi:hypothetical protein